MGKPSAPKAPNPTTTANAQAAANKDAIYASAKVNQIDQYTPYGNIIMGGSPEAGTQYVRQTLNPSDQKILNLQRSLGINAANQASQSLANPYQIESNYILPQLFEPSKAGYTADQYGGGEIGQARADQAYQQAMQNWENNNLSRQKVEDAYFNRASRLLEPQFENQRTRELTRLASQGIPEGGEAFDKSYNQGVLEAQNRVLGELADQAVMQGGQEQSRLFGLTQTGRQQDINEGLLSRTQPINELASILQGSQAIQSPNQASTPNYQIAPANVQGAVNTQYQGALNNFNNQNQNYQAGVGGLFGLGGSIASALPWGSWFSDMRMKTNIKPLMKGKYKWYTFNYLWDKTKRVGVIAQEVMKINPAAVTCEGGLYKVNYGEL